ncbi:protein of unknown function DUF1552 [Isosphaera pallida ATCC 43644]|uniref:DUF1552 domain-containing protein n=1 Tax=Isosphaera pallida (strain ATCC 43644 / DSM 9630 / IS1B) TaxID=575540 RepID=E8QXV8_ISOPI|nr:DUF1552 domain-containing protein [Isosphaera pallida]ADV60937.1 protein of unknown function DUF1552 [Isosphaera pallida ATCC 43644]
MSSSFRRISRRTVLRGAGVALALPWLEAMGPLTRLGRAAEHSLGEGTKLEGPPVRVAFLYMANGVNPHSWTPQGEGTDWQPSPILKPLVERGLKDDVLVLSNLWNAATRSGDGHYVKEAAWLCGTTITRTTGVDLCSGGTSVDQVIARRLGHLTPLPSLELGCEPTSTGVDQVVGYTRVYGAHLSWATPTTPLAKEINPKLAFDRLFRRHNAERSTTPEEDRSLLDLALEDARALKRRLGRADQVKVEEYLESVRAVEARIAHEASERAARYRDDPAARADIESLGGRVDLYAMDPGRLRERTADHTEHVRLMMDIIALAFQTDTTRVATFMFGNAVSNKNFSFLEGVSGGHHENSHHENQADKLAHYERIAAWHVEQYAYLLDKLRSISEGEGTLLDHAMIQFGSALRDGNTHNPHNLPIVVGGRAGGRLTTGRHLIYPKDTPLANLYVAMLDRAGAPVEHFADSQGPLANLEV